MPPLTVFVPVKEIGKHVFHSKHLNSHKEDMGTSNMGPLMD